MSTIFAMGAGAATAVAILRKVMASYRELLTQVKAEIA